MIETFIACFVLLAVADVLLIAGTWFVKSKFPGFWRRNIVSVEPPGVEEAELEIRRDEARREGLLK